MIFYKDKKAKLLKAVVAVYNCDILCNSKESKIG
jgi:hypothetical protein